MENTERTIDGAGAGVEGEEAVGKECVALKGELDEKRMDGLGGEEGVVGVEI